MAVIGRGSGIGHLIVKTRAEGQVNYSFTVFETGRRRSASGRLTGDQRLLHECFSAGSGALRLEDGGIRDIIIRHWTMDSADFDVNGPMPGF